MNQLKSVLVFPGNLKMAGQRSTQNGTEMTLSKIAPLALLTVVICSSTLAQEVDSTFDEPVFLKVGDAPMNEDGKMMYPSPVIMDVDNDGQNELVIGTIFGAVYACENSNSGSGDPVWEAPVSVSTVDDVPLKLNNW